MKIVIACDSFKGSLTSAEANAAVAAGIRKTMPEAEIVTFEVADGGEGTAEIITKALGGHLASCFVADPLGRDIVASYGVVDDLGVVDVAQACGLTLLSEDERNPLIATTFGVGEILNDAYTHGCRRFLIGLGGSATCDGGIGMLESLNDDVRKCRAIVMCDVNNPLCGPHGAARVFAPQKGATPEQVEMLEQRLQHLAGNEFRDVAHRAGAGAAGGLGAAFMTFPDVEIRPGVDVVLDILDFDHALADANLVITGEGCIDAQSLMGKLPHGILRRASAHNVDTIAIAGHVSDSEALLAAGFHALLAITPDHQSLAEALKPSVAAANINNALQDYFARS